MNDLQNYLAAHIGICLAGQGYRQYGFREDMSFVWKTELWEFQRLYEALCPVLFEKETWAETRLANEDDFQLALEELAELGILEKHEFKYAETKYRVNKGASVSWAAFFKRPHVKEAVDFHFPLVKESLENINLIGDANTDGIQTKSKVHIPASNRVVSLDDNRDEVNALGNEISKLRNEIAECKANDFPEKEAIQSELEAASMQLERSEVFWDSFKARIFNVCSILVNKFTDKSIGEIAKLILQNVTKLFGDG